MPQPPDQPISQPEDDIHNQPLNNRIFYGWWIVLGAMVILAITSGLGFFGHGLILDPLQEQFGWSKGAISSAITLLFLISAMVGPIVGEQVDRHGPTRALMIGAFIMGLGFIFLSRINLLWQLFAVYFLMGIGQSATHNIPTSTVIANWFVRKRGLAMSIAMSGLSIGGIFVVPLASQAIHRWGLKTSLSVFGLTYWVVIIPVALFLLKQRPSVMGLLPDGVPLTSSADGGSKGSIDYATQSEVWTRREAMGTKAFWAIVFAFLFGISGQMSFLIHEVSFMSQFVGPTKAATAISVTSGASLLGRFLLGAVVDRFDKRVMIMLCFFIQSAAMLTAGFSTQVVILYFCVFAFGMTMGNVVLLQSLIVGECFGQVSFGTVFGLAGLFISSVSSLGPMIAGFIYDATESYRIAFSIFAAMSAVATLFLIYAKPPRNS
jgi:MFS family permease